MGKIFLGSILHMTKGKKPKEQAAKQEAEFLPYVDIKAFEKRIIDNYASPEKCLLCQDGDVLIVCDGARSGLVGRAMAGVVGSTLALISADGCSNNYLFYFLQSLYVLLNTKQKGTGTPHLNPDILKKAQLVVPSLPEQERIVAKIKELFSQLDAAVAELKSVKEKLVIYRQSVLKEAFEGKISSRNKYDYVLDNQFRKISSRELEKLSPIPEHWRYVYLSDLGELARGKSKHRPRNDSRLFENGKYPFFQTGDVKSAQKELIECEKKYGDFGLAQSKLWPQGTLCITIAANIAETCFLGVDACFPDSIVGFTPNEAIVDKAYVRWFIEISKAQLWAFAPATAQKNINLTTLENLIVPYCSLKEQKIIVQDIEEKISVCNNIEQTVDTALQQAAALRQSILKQAFEGKL